MKGQLSLQTVLIILMGISAAGGFFYFFINLSSDTLAESQKLLIYPKEPIQILRTKCYSDFGVVILSSVEGDLLYTLDELNGKEIDRGVLSVNISELGEVVFGAPMDKGKQYTLRLYTPTWSITDTCTSTYDKDLAFFMPLDEGIGTNLDEKINNNDGTFSGGLDGSIIGASVTSGYEGDALSFNGSGNYVDLGNSSIFNFGLNNFTVSAWIKQEGSGSRIIMAKLQTDGWPGFSLLVRSTNTIRFETSGSFVDSTTVLTTDTWYFVTGVRDGNDIQIYINGEFENNNTLGSPSDVDGIGNLTIGKYGNFPTPNWYNGTIDEIRLYNRSLTISEISALYVNQSVIEDIIGYWGFNEKSLTVAHDNHMWFSGKKGSALFFDGTDLVTVTQPQEIELSEFAISYWFSPGNWDGSSWQGTQIRKYGGGSSRPYWIYGAKPASSLVFEMRPETGEYHALVSTKTNWVVGEFYHIVAQYEVSTGNWSLFVDGEFDKSLIDKIDVATSEGNLYVTQGFFDGAIDEVKIYSRILTNKEIKAIYDGYVN
ncbi:MAG: LamG domain-containing protein [Candidatus Altiarchaeota archaeon]|nr:LamG domain-containing protein [Candidatus Altiarchaeota archaeon]